MEMLPRQRVIAALNHQESDYVPLDVGGTDVTGINIRAYQRLLPLLDIKPPEQISILDTVQQLALIDEAVAVCLEAHCRAIFPKPASRWQFRLGSDQVSEYFTDEWGIVWRKPKEHGYYFDLSNHPLAGASLEQIQEYPWPDPSDPSRREGLIDMARKMHEDGRYALILSGITGGGAMELSAWLAGFENFYIALISDPAWADALLDHTLEAKLQFWQAVLPEVGPYIDIISESEDLGTQDRLLISPRLFQRHIKPRLRQLCEGIKKIAPHVKILLHSDGAIIPIIPDLIEVGVDILNPIQVSAKGMDDTSFLKREFGRDLVFWGGIDTQYVLPFGSPQQVSDEVKRRIDDLAPGGGYVVASVHNIQGDVPAENILAMVQAWKEYGKYI